MREKVKIVISKKNLNQLFVGLIILLGVILIINTFFIIELNTIVEKKVDLAKEKNRPADIELITIQDPNCNNCFDVSDLISSIKAANVKINKEEAINLDSDRAKELIDKYDIKKVPTILVFGEINKINIKDLEEKNGILIFTALKPPYTDAKTKQIIGLVSSILIMDSSCKQCKDLTLLSKQLEQGGVAIADERVLEINNEEAKNLIKKYSINLVPTLIFSKDFSAYDLDDVWKGVGSIEGDGSYVTRVINPPYVNLTTNKIVGLVKLTMLTDNGCDGCYNVSLHKNILIRLGLTLAEEETVDISETEGQSLIKKYNITKVPTIILSEEAKEYSAFVNVWSQVGTVETDGSHVFRNLETLKSTYKDLTSNKVISPK